MKRTAMIFEGAGGNNTTGQGRHRVAATASHAVWEAARSLYGQGGGEGLRGWEELDAVYGFVMAVERLLDGPEKQAWADLGLGTPSGEWSEPQELVRGDRHGLRTDLEGLEPGTKYEFSIEVSNPDGIRGPSELRFDGFGGEE